MRENSDETLRRRARRQRAITAARATGGVLQRGDLLRLGIDRWEIAGEIRAERWHRDGRQTIRVCDGDPQLARWYRAIWEVGGPAVLDGVSALVASGLRKFDELAVHVAVPKSANPRKCRGVIVHETRRFEAECVAVGGVPRMRPATAAVHAVLWAVTDRQAATIALMAGQQRLFTVAEFAEEVEKIRWDRRRRLLRTVLAELGGGIEAIGERDFARLCRRRGLPEPDRQVPRQGPSGRWFYDNRWLEYKVTAEIDGAQHTEPAAWMGDALKQNAASMDGHVVLRIPNVALWIDPEPFLDQLEEALRRGGWQGGRRSA